MNQKTKITAKALMYQKAAEKVKKKETNIVSTEVIKKDLKPNMKKPKSK